MDFAYNCTTVSCQANLGLSNPVETEVSFTDSKNQKTVMNKQHPVLRKAQ